MCARGVIARVGCPYVVLTLEFRCQHLHMTGMCFDATRGGGVCDGFERVVLPRRLSIVCFLCSIIIRSVRLLTFVDFEPSCDVYVLSQWCC